MLVECNGIRKWWYKNNVKLLNEYCKIINTDLYLYNLIPEFQNSKNPGEVHHYFFLTFCSHFVEMMKIVIECKNVSLITENSWKIFNDSSDILKMFDEIKLLVQYYTNSEIYKKVPELNQLIEPLFELFTFCENIHKSTLEGLDRMYNEICNKVAIINSTTLDSIISSVEINKNKMLSTFDNIICNNSDIVPYLFKQRKIQIRDTICINKRLEYIANNFDSLANDKINNTHLCMIIGFFIGMTSTFPQSVYLSLYDTAKKLDDFTQFNTEIAPFYEEIYDMSIEDIKKTIRLFILVIIKSVPRYMLTKLFREELTKLVTEIKNQKRSEFDRLEKFIDTNPNCTKKFVNTDDVIKEIVTQIISQIN